MPEQSTSIEDPFLEAELNNREAITALMQLYNVDESTATQLWEEFVNTVRRMKANAEEKRESAGAEL